MANLRKENPVGLDIPIDQIQKVVYPLKDLWGVDLTGYPRCYILQNKEGGKKIESFLDKKEYSGNLLYGEGNKFFFLDGEAVENVSNTYYKTTIELYFIINIKEAYPLLDYRADEEVRRDVLNALSTVANIRVVKLEKNSDKVFARFNNRISQNYEHDYRDDMQPYHYFKVLIDVLDYDINATYCGN